MRSSPDFARRTRRSSPATRSLKRPERNNQTKTPEPAHRSRPIRFPKRAGPQAGAGTSASAATVGSDTETQRVTYELEVHRIELEAQNGELRETQQQLEASRDRYADLYDFAPIGYATLDEKGHIREINLTGATLLGRERSRLIGMFFSVAVAKSSLKAFHDHLRQCAQGGGPVTTELTLAVCGCDPLQVQLQSVPGREPVSQATVYRTVLTDITTRKRAEEAVCRARDELEDRVRERTSELANANARLQQEIAAHKQDLNALRQSQQRFTAFMDNFPGFAWMKDLSGHYVYANQVVERLEPYQQGWNGKTEHEVWPSGVAAQFQANDQKVVANREALQTIESYSVEGKPRRVLVSKFPIIDESGRVVMVGGTGVDVTERIEAEQRVARARDFYLRLLDEFPNPIWRSGLDGRCDYFNKAWLAFTGRTLEQELGEGWAEGVHTEDLQHCLGLYREAFQARRSFVMEYRLRRSDGGYGWLVDSGSPYYNLEGEFAGFIGACLDISERKHAEQVSGQLPGRMLEAQEAERRHVARELHDSVSQTLSLARARILAVEAAVSHQDPAARQQAAEVRTLLEKTLEEVRRISHNLLPSELDNLGLVPSVRSLCSEFGRRTGLAVDLEISNVPRDLPANTNVAVFRITQEALTNVEKHAKAAKVRLHLFAEPAAVRATIQDDGVGFDPAAVQVSIQKDVRMGLTNMNQRAAGLGGTLQIISSAQGTTIHARIPFMQDRTSSTHYDPTPKDY
jgi:PAS domain S-box-containing protein